MKDMLDEDKSLQQTIENFSNEMEKEKQLTPKQKKIIEAAIHLFSEKGYDNSTTSDIAKEAGVAEVTIFRNFKSKSNLLHQILAPLIIQIASPLILKDVIKQFNDKENDSHKILTEVFKDRLSLIEKNEKVVQVMLKEALNHQEIRDSIIKNITIPAKKETSQFVKTRKENGEFRDVNEEAVVDLLFYTIFGYVISHHIFKLTPFTEEKDEMIETIVNLLLEGLKK